MKPLNTFPIESFLEKAKIASKTNQKFLTLEIKDVNSLAESLGVVMTRLAGDLDSQIQKSKNDSGISKINMDGGSF